jgi:hypothetical protein
MQWENDLPVMGVEFDGNGIGEPVAAFKKPAVSFPAQAQAHRTSDEFDGSKLGLQWQWQANPQNAWYADGRDVRSLRNRPAPRPDAYPQCLRSFLPAFSINITKQATAAWLWLSPLTLVHRAQKIGGLHYTPESGQRGGGCCSGCACV